MLANRWRFGARAFLLLSVLSCATACAHPEDSPEVSVALAEDALSDGCAVSLMQLRALQSRRLVAVDPPETIDKLKTAADRAESEQRDAEEAEALKEEKLEEKIHSLQEDFQEAKAELEKQMRDDGAKETEMWNHIEKMRGRLQEAEAKEEGQRLEVKVADADEKALEEDLKAADTEEEMEKAEAKVEAAGDNKEEDENLEKHQELETTKTAIETLRNEIADSKAEYDATVMVDKLGRLAHQEEIKRLESSLEAEKLKLEEEKRSDDEQNDHLQQAEEELKKQIDAAIAKTEKEKVEENPTQKPTENPTEKPTEKPKPATTTSPAPVQKSPFDSFGDIEDDQHTASLHTAILLHKDGGLQQKPRGSWAWSAW